MNNKGKSRKRAAAIKSPQNANHENVENATNGNDDISVERPLVNTDESKKNEPEITANLEKPAKKGKKRVGKALVEKNEVLKSKDEAPEIQEPPSKQVRGAKIGKKNSDKKIEKTKALDESSSGSSSTSTEQNDANIANELKDKVEAVSKLLKNRRGKKNKVQKSEDQKPDVIPEVKEEETNVLSSNNGKEKTTEVASKTAKKRTRQNKSKEKNALELSATTKKPATTKKIKTQKLQHEETDASNEPTAIDLKEETPEVAKPTKKQAKQKKNTKSKEETTEKGEVNINTKKVTKQTGDAETGDVSPDDDFEIQKPVVKKVTKPKSTKKPASAASSAKEEKGPKPPNRSILQLKVVLRDITPQIYRRIQVLNNTTFYDLSSYINEAMGWMSSHSHQFIAVDPKKNSNILIVNGELEGITYNFSERNLLKEQTTKLSRFLTAKDDGLLYEYDMGDSWIHEVVVERILPPPPPKAEYPRCTGGKRACPPEDCGGVNGYEHLLEVYKNPNHKEYEELITDWLGELNPGWDPEKFDKKKVFKRVRMWVWAPS